MKHATKKFLVPFDGSFSVENLSTKPPSGAPDSAELKNIAEAATRDLGDLQKVFYASRKYSLLLMLQGIDASGKDGVVRAVLSQLNPAGCEVTSFKAPTAEELEHDFLWRTTHKLPRFGNIGVFNRSYYEDVLIVRVHPEFLDARPLAQKKDRRIVWENRFAAIIAHEKHLVDSGTIILKFWLNISKEEQKKRFLARLDKPHHNWKFSPDDIKERAFYAEYQAAFGEALKITSRSQAPWYAIPADNKAYMHAAIATIVAEKLKSLRLSYPKSSSGDQEYFSKIRQMLINE